MILDTSALLAVVFAEPDAQSFARAMATADRLRMSTVHWFEATMAVDARGSDAARERFEDAPREIGFELMAFTEHHARLAREAWQRFGRTSPHLAKLNFGDCMAYGVARFEGEPLLFKGNDFSRTDIEAAA